MYHHPGEYVTDFCITRHDDLFHLFHIRGERWTWPSGYQEIDLGHAISEDLRHWTPMKPVVPAGPRGEWDEVGVWAPDVIEADGTFHLYYTGSDAKRNQQIGLATSTDLFHWTKYPDNPIVTPGEWSDRLRGQASAGRDGMVFHDGRRACYLMYYTATLADGRPCIALARSADLLTWEDMGPTYIEEDRAYNRCESAYLVERDDVYYLFYSAKGGPQSKGHSPDEYAHFDIVYLMSDDPTGGWRKPENHELLKGWVCASEHPTFDGTTYMFYVIQEEIEGIWGASLLSDPKVIQWQEDATVKIVEYLPGNVGRRTLFRAGEDTYHGWYCSGDCTVSGEGDVAVDSPGTHSVMVNPLWGRDVTAEVEIQGDAESEASLLVRSNPSGTSGYRVALDFSRSRVSIWRRLYQHDEALIAERDADIRPGQPHKLKVTMQGKIMEVYVDDGLQIVRSNRTFEDGCFGLDARGRVRFRRLYAYEPLGPERLDSSNWERRCLPRHLFPGT